MSGFTKAQALAIAASGIAAAGELAVSATLTRDDGTGAYDPMTGTVTPSTTAHTCTIIPFGNVGSKADGVVVVPTDNEWYVMDIDTAPLQGDTVTAAGNTVTVVKASDESAGAGALYVCVVRDD